MRRILSSSQCYFWSCFILIPWGQDSPPYANEETKACELNRLALGHRGNEVRFQLLTPAASVTSACLLTNYIPLSRRCTLISTGHNPQTVETSATEDNKCFWAAKWSVDSQLIDYFDKVMISSCACKCQHMQMAETSQTNSECPHERKLNCLAASIPKCLVTWLGGLFYHCWWKKKGMAPSAYFTALTWLIHMPDASQSKTWWQMSKKHVRACSERS